ncbi:hypothetical protein GHT06_010262 [Daphnia sinensis]|uniref:Uncharacterized protein n=1 Tax=Daphnia sinensis TaxID=1820382 RepID=A0AAD5L0Q9_9CRUS|nr:hypothetical protein GHT06_010262 [Daphnia sinensis]
MEILYFVFLIDAQLMILTSKNDSAASSTQTTELRISNWLLPRRRYVSKRFMTDSNDTVKKKSLIIVVTELECNV